MLHPAVPMKARPGSFRISIAVLSRSRAPVEADVASAGSFQRLPKIKPLRVETRPNRDAQGGACCNFALEVTKKVT
jgi:hypothetical protein